MNCVERNLWDLYLYSPDGLSQHWLGVMLHGRLGGVVVLWNWLEKFGVGEDGPWPRSGMAVVVSRGIFYPYRPWYSM